MELEKDVESYLKSQVKKRGGLSLKFVSPGTRGVPDQIILRNGHVFFVEVKKPEGATRASQIKMQSVFGKHGHNYHFVRSKAEVDTFIIKMEFLSRE